MKDKVDKAIALLYDSNYCNAPFIISKGENILANRMVEIANKYKIPVVSNEETARDLMKLNIGEEIPSSLYESVSIILKYIYQLKAEIDNE